MLRHAGACSLYHHGGNPCLRGCHCWYVSCEPTLATILFDFGASHSFISQMFASKHDQKIIVVDKGGYCISSAGASISTNQIVRDVLISKREREYTMYLIVLLGLGIYVILGMNWMSGHGVLIDTTTRTIMLREPKGDGVFLVPLPRSFELQNLSCAI
jgi:hypothetical protein